MLAKELRPFESRKNKRLQFNHFVGYMVLQYLLMFIASKLIDSFSLEIDNLWIVRHKNSMKFDTLLIRAIIFMTTNNDLWPRPKKKNVWFVWTSSEKSKANNKKKVHWYQCVNVIKHAQLVEAWCHRCGQKMWSHTQLLIWNGVQLIDYNRHEVWYQISVFFFVLLLSHFSFFLQ